MSDDIVQRMRGKYRIPITDGMGPAGGDEPDNAREFVRQFPTVPIQVEAADRIAALQAELASGSFYKESDIDALMADRDKTKELRRALEIMLHAVCGETGFASAVRQDSGFAYPWPALDEAERIARAALGAA